jgi:hypothetical protein
MRQIDRFYNRLHQRRRIMFDILKIKVIMALQSLQGACLTAVIRDDDGDDGDIATPKTCTDDEGGSFE